MKKAVKWLPRLSRSRKKEKHCEVAGSKPLMSSPVRREETEEEVMTTTCDSDTSISAIDKTFVHYNGPLQQDVHNIFVNDDEAGSDEPSHDMEHFDMARQGMAPSASFGVPCCGPVVLEKTEDTQIRIRREQPPRNRQLKDHTSQDAESFECIYREEGFDSRDDLPLVSTSNSLRGDGSSNICYCTGEGRHRLPHLHPSQWPQAPLLLRPKPNGSTRILGVRKENATDYLWQSGQKRAWWEVIQKEWCNSTTSKQPENNSLEESSTSECCEFCVILPINNGSEEDGESLVVDFETPLFEGTLLFRIKDSSGTTKEAYSDDKGYFAGTNLRYQAVIRGRFKTQLAFSSLQTGTRLDRPCGKLPPKWVMWTAMKVIQFFAPQLQAQIEKVDKPYVLSPLGSAPRTIILENETIDPNNVDGKRLSSELSEPTDAAGSLLGRENPVKNPLERARARKRQLDQWFMAKSEKPRARVDKIYTFEFLQHLFDYHNFSIELGNSIQANVKDLLYGQPLQLMAEYHREGQELDADNNLWAFEIWNECLWDDAMECLQNAGASKCDD